MIIRFIFALLLLLPSIWGQSPSHTKNGNSGSFGFEIGLSLGFYNGDTPPELPFNRSPFDSKLKVGLIKKFYLSRQVGLLFSPSYNLVAFQSFLFTKPNVLAHQFVNQVGFELLTSRNIALLAGGIINYEFAGTLIPDNPLSGTPSSVSLNSKDLAQPGFGGYLGVLVYFKRNKNQNIAMPVTIEVYQSALNYLFVGVKVGLQIGFNY